MYIFSLISPAWYSNMVSRLWIQVCRVWLDQIEHCHVNTRFSHILCGHFVDKTRDGDFKCKFCHSICNAEVVRIFHVKITLADDTGKVFAWCTGQTAAELLQISTDEFYELPEVMQKGLNNLLCESMLA